MKSPASIQEVDSKSDVTKTIPEATNTCTESDCTLAIDGVHPNKSFMHSKVPNSAMEQSRRNKMLGFIGMNSLNETQTFVEKNVATTAVADFQEASWFFKNVSEVIIQAELGCLQGVQQNAREKP